jgi:hypothetical protein
LFPYTKPHVRLSIEHRSNRKHISEVDEFNGMSKNASKEYLDIYAEYMDRYSYTWAYIRKIIQTEI